MRLPRRSLPAMARVRQQLPTDHIEGVANDVRDKLLAWGIGSRVRPGDRVAITAGSRGIGGFVQLLSGIAEAAKACRARAFIVFSSLAGPAERVCRIKNTAMLGEMWVSPALLAEVDRNPALHIVQPPSTMPFDENGNLL